MVRPNNQAIVIIFKRINVKCLFRNSCATKDTTHLTMLQSNLAGNASHVKMRVGTQSHSCLALGRCKTRYQSNILRHTIIPTYGCRNTVYKYVKLFCFLNLPILASFSFIFIVSTRHNNKFIKAQMVCLGLEPGVA